MNHRHTLLCCLLFCWGCATQQQAWKAYPIDPQLTVRFPIAPQELSAPGILAAKNSPNKDSPQVQASQAFRAEDATATYILVSIPVVPATPLLGTTSEREEYYKDRGIPLMVSQMKGELLEQVVTATPNLDSYTIKLRALTADGQPGVKYVRVLATGSRVYQLYFIPKDKTGEVGAEQREQFFNTTVN